MMETQQVPATKERVYVSEEICVETVIAAGPGDTERIVLIFPRLQLDRSRVNRKEARVDINGDLSNVVLKASLVATCERFQTYRGTCTVRTLSPTERPQYWEVRARVRLRSPITNITFTVFELGLSVESERDLNPSLRSSSNSIAVQVIHCAKDDRICVRVVARGKELDHIKTKIEMVPEKTMIFRYGILFFPDKIGFLDAHQNVLMTVLEGVDTTRLRWPMFGVCNERVAEVKLKLITDSQIDLSGEKRRVVEQELRRIPW